MDKHLRGLIDRVIPKMNPTLAGGLACVEVPHAMQYVDSILRASSRRFPDEFHYVGIEVCTPEETVEYATKKRDSKRTYDVAVSYLRLYRLTFKLDVLCQETKQIKPKTIYRYLYLPYVGPGGEIFISGTRNFISPVLADKVISKQPDSIFVRLNSARPTFRQEAIDLMATDVLGNKVRTTQHFAWAHIYLQNKIKAKTTMTHYLLCKYGYDYTFSHFAGCRPKVMLAKQWDPNLYPPEEWVGVFSTNVKLGVDGKANHTPNPFCMAVPRPAWESLPKLRRMVASFFYVTDVCSQQYLGLTIDNVDEYLTQVQWYRNLGVIIHNGGAAGGVMMEKIQKHMSSLDKYLDEVVAKRLKEVGIEVADFYEFFDVIEANIQEWMLEGLANVNSIFGKELNILTFLMYLVTEAITTFCFKLANKVDPKNKKELTEKTVVDLLNQTLRPGLMFSMTKRNSEVQPGSVPGDNMATKITTMMVPQQHSSKGASKNSSKPTPDQTMHVSVPALGSYGGMPKKYPDGRNRLNIYAQLTELNILTYSKDLDELLKRTQDIMSGRRSIKDDTL